MNRHDFEALRGLPGKVIEGDIKLAQKQATHPLLTADRIAIANDRGVPIWMNINFNPQTGAKGINVTAVGEGPICRLDVDGPCHGAAGRSHKHAVTDADSVRRDLRDGVAARPELSGKPLREVFEEFCRAAQITHRGRFESPEAGDDA